MRHLLSGLEQTHLKGLRQHFVRFNNRAVDLSLHMKCLLPKHLEHIEEKRLDFALTYCSRL